MAFLPLGALFSEKQAGQKFLTSPDRVGRAKLLAAHAADTTAQVGLRIPVDHFYYSCGAVPAALGTTGAYLFAKHGLGLNSRRQTAVSLAPGR